MRRAPGWTRLAGIALELAALAFLAYAVMRRADESASAQRHRVPRETPQIHETPASEPVVFEPMDFIAEAADENARYYRASDEDVEIFAGFYSDGRLRLADARNHRFAGMLEGSRADLLELGSNEWSQVFLRVTPTGRMQLELRGGPYDTRVLTCDRMT